LLYILPFEKTEVERGGSRYANITIPEQGLRQKTAGFRTGPRRDNASFGGMMDSIDALPDAPIVAGNPVSDRFLALGTTTFHAACRYAHEMPYGYNSDREDLFILFTEQKGSCTTKHAVIATLAQELGLPVHKYIGVYAMTETIVTGTDRILNRFGLPYLPMVHCFLADERCRVDLTEGNRNGKNTAIDAFLYTEKVIPHISGKDEYLIYRRALRETVLPREEFAGVDLKTVLHAREEGLVLLREKVEPEG
jgi:hypothetical protein